MGQTLNGQLHRFIKAYPRKRVTLEELREKCPDAEELQEQIIALVNNGVLAPVKNSGTNGNKVNPLYMKYNICTEKSPEIPTDDIYALHPHLLENGYLLRNKLQYANNRKFLQDMSRWLTSHHNDGMMSRRERSLVIFGDEKMLDNHLKLLEGMGITVEDLDYYETPEECYSDYIPVRKPEMTLLVCENKDRWFNIRRVLLNQWLNMIYGDV